MATFVQIIRSINFKKYWWIILVAAGILTGSYFAIQKSSWFLGLSLNNRISACHKSNSEPCYVGLVMDVFNKQGLDKALNLVTVIYAQDQSFSSSCHDVGHLLGAATYKLFKEGKPFKITPNAAFCSYGFYHGFMEALASEGDVSKARDFCTYVDNQISKETPDAALQCYHGIGHGWVNIHGDKTLLGDDLGIAKKGLALCEKVAANDSELSRCATGVFNGIAIFYANGENGLKVRSTDPMWICRSVDAKFQDPCYISMNTVLYQVTNANFKLATSYIEQIASDSIAQHSMINLALPFSLNEMNKTDHTQSINVCRSLQKRLVNSCFQGFAFAYLEHGEPGKEYVKAINFCKANGLTKTEEAGCLSYIYGYLAQWYPKDKALGICSSEGSYKDLCINSVTEGLRGLTK